MGIFDNVKILMINEKEVQSLVMNFPEGDAVIYQKEIFTGELSLTTPENEVLVGDTFILTATLTSETYPIEEQFISFYDGDILLETVNTDSNGIATLSQVIETNGTKNYKATFNSLNSEINITAKYGVIIDGYYTL